MANPNSGIGRQINKPVVFACMGNEKDLETKRLHDSHACIFSVHLVIWYERITGLANHGEGNFKYDRIIDIQYHLCPQYHYYHKNIFSYTVIIVEL